MSRLTQSRGILGIVAATLVTPVVAQNEPSFLEEIVVTSTKRQSTLQEIPVAVSVIQGADIKESQILDIKDLQFLVPSLRITQLQSSGNTNFIIRGFGNGANNAGIEPSVGVFIDGVYRSRSAAALNDLPNLERMLQLPAGRLGTPEDLGAAALFLCSKASEWITGQCINVSGGP